MTAGQVSDYTGAAALLGSLPKAEWLLADRGYDADWFTDALKDKGIKPCIPGRKSRGKPIKHDKRRYKRRNRIEIMFGRLMDRRRVATRYDRCPKVFHSARRPDFDRGNVEIIRCFVRINLNIPSCAWFLSVIFAAQLAAHFAVRFSCAPG